MTDEPKGTEVSKLVRSCVVNRSITSVNSSITSVNRSITSVLTHISLVMLIQSNLHMLAAGTQR